MKQPPHDDEREERISLEIVVDAYSPQEQAMGWYYYLEGQLQFPFPARCTAKRAISPLRPGEEVDVLRMAPEKECAHEMFVQIRWERGPLAVPLSQLDARAADEETREAVEDWRYWVARGYEL